VLFQTPRRGNLHLAQGIALGRLAIGNCALKGQQHLYAPKGFCPYRAKNTPHLYTQGVALGWWLAAPSGRSTPLCTIRTVTLACSKIIYLLRLRVHKENRP